MSYLDLARGGILVVNFRIVLLSRLWWMPLLRLGVLLLLLAIIIQPV